MLVTLSSASGAPGVSAWALALTIALPGRRSRVLLEADLAGGVLSGRYGLASDPGTESLLASVRERPFTGPDLSAHGRRLAPGRWCVVGPPTATPSRQVWRTARAVVPDTLADDRNLWLVDCGRAEVGGALGPVLDRAVAHIVVTGGSAPALVKARDHARQLPGPTRVGLLVLAPRVPDPVDLPRLGGDDAVWGVARPPSLAVLAIRALHSRRARRTRAWRTVDRAAMVIGHWLFVPPTPTGSRS